MKKTFSLFITFLKIGFSIHGGGYVMVGVMEKEIVEKLKLIDEDSYMEIIGVCQSLPGPLAITSSAFVGYRLNKFAGAMACLFGTLIPAFLTVVLIATVLLNFSKIIYVQHALMGIRAAVPILVISAAIKFWQKMNKSYYNIGIAVIAFCVLVFLHLNAALVIVVAAILGMIVYRTVLKGEK